MLTGRRDSRDIQATYPDWRQLWHAGMEDALNLDVASWGVMENNTVTNVTVQLGATAFLHCHVRTFGDRTIGGAEASNLPRHKKIKIRDQFVFEKN